MRIRFLIFTIFVIAFASCSKDITEKEPENNYRKTAQELKSGQTFRGHFYRERGKDVDYVFYRVSSPALITGKLSGVKGVDSEILLFKKGMKKPFKVINDNGSSLEEVFGPIYIEPPGVVLALRPRKIESLSKEELKELPYTFRGDILNVSEPSEIEPNDSLEEAQEIKDEKIYGYYSTVFAAANQIEKDFYYLRLEDEKKYLLNITLTGVKGIDPIVRLYNKAGKEIKTFDEGKVNEGETIEGFGIKGPGEIYISISSKDPVINISEAYRLQVEKAEHEAKYEFEPNDSFENASELKEDITYAELDHAKDKDFFILNNTNEWPVSARIEVVPDDQTDIQVTLYNSFKRRLAVFNDGDKGAIEGLSNVLIPAASAIYLKIEGSSDKEGSAKYEIQTLVENMVDNHELEPNNKKSEATPVPLNISQIGYINPSNDVDFYKFTAEAKGTYVVAVEGLDGCLLQTSLLKENGTILNKALAPETGEGIEVSALVEGSMFIVIRCEETTKNLYNSPYTFIIKRAKSELPQPGTENE